MSFHLMMIKMADQRKLELTLPVAGIIRTGDVVRKRYIIMPLYKIERWFSMKKFYRRKFS